MNDWWRIDEWIGFFKKYFYENEGPEKKIKEICGFFEDPGDQKPGLRTIDMTPAMLLNAWSTDALSVQVCGARTCHSTWEIAGLGDGLGC